MRVTKYCHWYISYIPLWENYVNTFANYRSIKMPCISRVIYVCKGISNIYGRVTDSAVDKALNDTSSDWLYLGFAQGQGGFTFCSKFLLRNSQNAVIVRMISCISIAEYRIYIYKRCYIQTFIMWLSIVTSEKIPKSVTSNSLHSWTISICVK